MLELELKVWKLLETLTLLEALRGLEVGSDLPAESTSRLVSISSRNKWRNKQTCQQCGSFQLRDQPVARPPNILKFGHGDIAIIAWPNGAILLEEALRNLCKLGS